MGEITESAARQALLVNLTQWLARVMQYSASHPACASFGEKVHESLIRALDECSPLAFGILKNAVTVDERDGELVAVHPSVTNRLAPHLHERGVLVLRFMNGTSLDELTRLMGALILPVQTIFDRGGIAEIVRELGVARIRIDEIAHDITAEEREAQRQRKELRSFFAAMLRGLLAKRSAGIDIARHLLELLDHPEIAVAILEDDPLAVGVATAALCLMVQEEENRSGIELFPKLRVVLVALAPASHDRVLQGFPSLVGEFRNALAWAFGRLSEDDLAVIAFASFCRHAAELDTVFYALSVAVPHDGSRRASLRRLALFFYDLARDDPETSTLLASAAAPIPDYDSYRGDRLCLQADAVGALAQRTPIFGVMGSKPPVASRPPATTASDAAFDGRRPVAEVVKLSSRTRRFDRLCTRLPSGTAHLAAAGSTDAVLGVIEALHGISRSGARELAANTLAQLSSASIVGQLLAEIDRAASVSEESDLGDVIATVQMLVALQPATVLDRLDTCDNRKMRRIFLDALPSAGKPLLPLLREKLKSPQWFVVRNAVGLIARVGGGLSDLIATARHPHEKVRAEIARTLRALPPDADATTIAAIYLGDPVADVRIQVRGLVRGELASVAALQTLEDLAGNEQAPDESRRSAVEALGRSVRDEAAAALYRLLHPKSLIERGAVRDLAAVALRASKAPSAVGLFAEGLKSSAWRVRKACERAAGDER